MINYYLLTKPGIVLGNLITVAAGFLLASKGVFHFALFLATLLGLALIMASACVFNNLIDRKVDEKMKRTKTRALVMGTILAKNACLFAALLFVAGSGILIAFTNLITFLAAAIGFFVYVVLYSFWKCHTIYGTAIGSIAGAVPPVVGYLSVSNQFDFGALILFTMMVLWQMPHFFSIALLHFDDYLAAGIPTLPIKKGTFQTKMHMSIYIACFTVAATLLTAFQLTGYIYLTVALLSSLAWFVLSLKGFTSTNDQLWSKQMFRVSLILIMAISFVIPFDTV